MNSDLGWIGTRPSTFYAKLNTYNQDNLFGPPINPIVPSMQYITLPQEHVNYGYDALTHHGDGNNYYSVTTGYGNKCTTFNTAKCPTNQIIGGAGAVPAPAPAPSVVREGFQQNPSLNSQLKNLDLVVYTMEGCGYCTQYKSMIHNSGHANVFRMVNINNPREAANDKFLQQTPLQGFPTTYSKSKNKHFLGVPSNLEEIVIRLG
jgi:hypothetical protein